VTSESAGKGPALDDSKDDTYVLGLSGYFIVSAAYIFLVIILLNLLIAMFSKTFDNFYENADREYFLKRAELLFEWKQATVCPPPFNVIEDICKIFGHFVRDIQRECQKHMIADEEEDIPDAGNTAPDEFSFDKDFIVPQAGLVWGANIRFSESARKKLSKQRGVNSHYCGLPAAAAAGLCSRGIYMCK
jgi:hypothetical protein